MSRACVLSPRPTHPLRKGIRRRSQTSLKPAFRFRLSFVVFLVSLSSQLFPSAAADVSPARTSERPAAQNSLGEEPAVAMKRFVVAPGLQVSLFAAEPEVRHPVALSIDEHGRVFVVESERRRSSVFDIRGHPDWLEADFALRTVSGRAEFLRREVSPQNPAALERLTRGGRGEFHDFNQDGILDWQDLEVQSERIRLLEDTDADGRADRTQIFAADFTNLVAGVAAGVLARRGDLYFACIPDVWRLPYYPAVFLRATGQEKPTLPDINAPPLLRAGSREMPLAPMLSGFGVHIAFGGHDMHGLLLGPDGRLYWSIADRGTDTNLFSRLINPPPGLTPELLADSGCIFRATPT